MAIVQNPITGRTSRTLGNAVFSQQYGKNTLRSKPIRVRDAKTPAQESVRKRFRILVKLLTKVVPVMNEAYAGSLTTMTPFNRILSINFKNAFTGNPFVLDHTKVVFCDFDGSTVDNVVLSTTPNHGVHVVWDPNTTNAVELGTNLTFTLVNTTTDEVLILRSVALRSAGTVDFTVPKTWVGSMTALHIVTTDSTQLLKSCPKTIIKFKAGVDAASIIQ